MNPDRFTGIVEDDDGVGFGIHTFLINFNDSFLQSGAGRLENFLRDYDYVKKWILVSDYAFHDFTKTHDVVTFTLVPYIADFDTLCSQIDSLAPVDIKSCRKVNPEFLEILATGHFFNVSIKLDRVRRLHTSEPKYFTAKINAQIKQLELWCETTPSNISYFRKIIFSLKQLKKLACGSGGNMKVIRDIEIISQLASYFLYEVNSRAKVDLISWFSDRDALLNYKPAKLGKLMFDLVGIYYHVFCETEEKDKGKLFFAQPELNGPLWYDSLVRVPDLIAGTLADYNYIDNKTSHKKFIPVIDRLLAEEARNLFYSIRFDNTYSVGRLVFGRQLAETPSA